MGPFTNTRDSKKPRSINGSPVYVVTATADTPFRIVDCDVFCQQIDFQGAGPSAGYVGDMNNQVLLLQNGTTYTVYDVNLKDYWFKNLNSGYNMIVHAHCVLA